MLFMAQMVQIPETAEIATPDETEAIAIPFYHTRLC